MVCPVCDAKMKAVEKHGVEVDICPDCKGVWLDKGELDKIIEMFNQGSDAYPEPSRENYRKEERREPEFKERETHRDYDEDSHRSSDRHKEETKFDKNGRPIKKRGSMLGDIFDMFGGGD